MPLHGAVAVRCGTQAGTGNILLICRLVHKLFVSIGMQIARSTVLQPRALPRLVCTSHSSVLQRCVACVEFFSAELLAAGSQMFLLMGLL